MSSLDFTHQKGLSLKRPDFAKKIISEAEKTITFWEERVSPTRNTSKEEVIRRLYRARNAYTTLFDNIGIGATQSEASSKVHKEFPEFSLDSIKKWAKGKQKPSAFSKFSSEKIKGIMHAEPRLIEFGIERARILGALAASSGIGKAQFRMKISLNEPVEELLGAANCIVPDRATNRWNERNGKFVLEFADPQFIGYVNNRTAGRTDVPWSELLSSAERKEFVRSFMKVSLLSSHTYTAQKFQVGGAEKRELFNGLSYLLEAEFDVPSLVIMSGSVKLKIGARHFPEAIAAGLLPDSGFEIPESKINANSDMMREAIKYYFDNKEDLPLSDHYTYEKLHERVVQTFPQREGEHVFDVKDCKKALRFDKHNPMASYIYNRIFIEQSATEIAAKYIEFQKEYIETLIAPILQRNKRLNLLEQITGNSAIAAELNELLG